MEIEFTGRQLVISKKLRAQAEEGLERIGLILGDECTAHVILTVAKGRQSAEITLQCRLTSIVGQAEGFDMESALHSAIDHAEKQARRQKARMLTRKRQPKPEKDVAALPKQKIKKLAAMSEEGAGPSAETKAKPNGNGKQRVLPVVVHSFPSKMALPEPHVVRSTDSVALRPMSLEEAVKEAEFRDREVFVFRDNAGKVMVLHRKKDGKMELIEAP